MYNEYWAYIEDAVGVENMERFFVDYLVCRRRSDSIYQNGKTQHLVESHLYDFFKNYYTKELEGTENEKIHTLFSEMKSCAQIYKNFFFPDDINLSNASLIQKKLYFMLTILDSKGTRCLLLYLFDLQKRGVIDETTRDASIDAIHSLLFRSRICNGKGLNRQFAGNVIAKLHDTADSSVPFMNRFWAAITAGKGSFSFPTDLEFRDKLITADLYETLRGKGTKYMLYMLELCSPLSKGLPAFDNPDLTVEHIMPQNISKWTDYLTMESLENRDKLLHTLGNLALTHYNSEMSNKPFAEKKTDYNAGNFYYTRMVAEFANWQTSDIEKRSRLLADAAIKAWPLPAEYQPKRRATSVSLYTLGDDFSQFTFTKPALLYIGDNEFTLKNWSELPVRLCEVLDNENHEIFRSVADPKQLGCFSLDLGDGTVPDKRSFYHVLDNLYIRRMSVDWILTNTAKITSRFDALAGTDYNSTTMFTLKPQKSN